MIILSVLFHVDVKLLAIGFFSFFFCSFVETPDWGSYGVVHSCQTFLFSRQSWEVILEQSLVGVDNPLEMEGGLAETCDGFKT